MSLSSRYYKGYPHQYVAYHTASPELTHIPIHGGVKIAHAGEGGGASIAIVRKGTKPYLISNKHVFANEYGSEYMKGQGTAAEYLKMVAAVKLTKATPITSGGKVVARTVPSMQNRLFDIAFAEPTVPVSWEVPGIGMQTGSVVPTIGMKVITAGGTTGQNFGTVSAYKSLLSPDMLLAEFPGAGAASGDSGSPLFQVGTGKVVGLVRGGGKLKNIPVIEFITAPAIEKAFGVSFAPGTGAVTLPSPSPTSAPSPLTGRGTTSSDDPIQALIQIILAFIEDLLGAIGAKR